MKKTTKRRILLLIVAFLAAFFLSFLFLNRNYSSRAEEFSKPTLPLVTAKYGDSEINELHGYTSRMNAGSIGGSVVPLGDDRSLPLVIRTYGRSITGISYEIRSSDTSRKISEETIKKFTSSGSRIETTLHIANLVESGQEYLLCLTLQTGGQKIYYYTMITLPKDAHISDCLTFAGNFHDMALSKNTDGISTYLETDNLSDDTSELYQVDIHSTPDQVAWKNFDGEVTGTSVTEINAASDDATALTMYYRMKKTSGGKAMYFDVKEYFLIRYGSDRMFLLDYQRSMTQIYGSGTMSLTTDGLLNLGVNQKNLNYISNELGTVVAFEMDGDLYEVNENNGQVTRVFSFRNGNVSDHRLNWNQHSILLLKMDETGTMDFVVSGYMNSGNHEGSCGIGLYRYNSRTGNTEEQAFVRSERSYQNLENGYSDLIYKSNDNHFYILANGILLRIDLDTLKAEEAVTGLKSRQYAVSQSGRYLSWTSKNSPSDQIHVMDLETEKEFDIKASEGELLKPLVFIDDDFVYGVMREADYTAAGSADTFPMYKIEIADITGSKEKILKEYQKDGFYITGVTEDSYTLYLNRSTGTPAALTAADQDTIKDSDGEKNRAVTLMTSSSDTLGTVSGLQLKKLSEMPKTMTLRSAGIVHADSSRTVSASSL